MISPRIAIAWSVLFVVLGSGFARAQQAAIRQGDSVTVVVPRAEVRSGEVLVGEARNGEVFFVRGVAGDWLEVLVGGKAGYLARSAVRRTTAGATRKSGGPAQAQAAASEKGRRYALLAGVREYDATQLKSLQFSEADVEVLADILPDLGYRTDDVVVMTQGRAKSFRRVPTAANIRRELDLLLVEAGPDDTLLVALAGHGVQFRGESESFFCPADVRLEDRSTLLSLGEVYSALESSKAGSKVMLIDACRNDPQSAVARSRQVFDLESVSRPQTQPPPGGVAAFFSCSTGQQAFEHPDLKHGVFFNYVIEGLKGAADLDRDEMVDLAELEQYTGKRVQSYVRTNLAQTQTPERRGEARGGLSLGRLEGNSGPPLDSADAYLKRGNDWHNDAQAYGKAIADYTEAIRLDPNFAAAYNNRGFSRDAKGDQDGAFADYTEAIRLDPNLAEAYNNRGLLRDAKDDQAGAIADYTEAIRLDPDFAEAYSNRGFLRDAKDDRDGAIADFTEAIRLDPNYAEAYNALAWRLATAADVRRRDGGRGVELATKACELTDWKDSEYIDTLAAAHAEAGDFAAAVTRMDAAIALLGPGADAGKLAEFRGRLDLYHAGKPYRQTPNP